MTMYTKMVMMLLMRVIVMNDALAYGICDHCNEPLRVVSIQTGGVGSDGRRWCYVTVACVCDRFAELVDLGPDISVGIRKPVQRLSIED